MSDIQFDNENRAPTTSRQKKAGGMTGWILDKGIASTKKQAQYFMFGVITVCVVVTGIIIFTGQDTQSSTAQEEPAMIQ